MNTTELSFHFKEGEDANSGQLGLPNLGGVFIVLFGGMVMSCIIAVGEFMWNARQTIKDPEVRSYSLSVDPFPLTHSRVAKL